MPFAKKPQVFNGSINELTIGTGDKAVTLGGQNVYNLYTFDAPIANRPKVGLEISDNGCDIPAALFAGVDCPVERAKKAAALDCVDFLCIRFDGADPNGENKSVEECVELAKKIADAVDKPLVIAGCKNIEKDSELFTKMSEALQGKNILILSAKEENYKGVAASAGLAYGQKVGAESAVDINLAKQLNVLITQMGVNGKNVAMNVGSAAAGYGFEYVASTMERVKAAALGQNDAALQMPIVTPVGAEAWSVKEAMASAEDMPEWGDQETRGIAMEVETAAACLAYGSDAVILKHPSSAETIARLIAALM